MCFSFHASVADEAMANVGRLFNASLDDILNELLQNARRSGATAVVITQIDDPELGAAISVADNGPGLANPDDRSRSACFIGVAARALGCSEPTQDLLILYCVCSQRE